MKSKIRVFDKISYRHPYHLVSTRVHWVKLKDLGIIADHSCVSCRALDPIILPTETSQVVKQRLLNFVRSLSTVLAFACCLSR